MGCSSLLIWCLLSTRGLPQWHRRESAGATLRRARQTKQTHPKLLHALRCRLIVLALELGGCWSLEAAEFVRMLSRSRAPPAVQAASTAAYVSRRCPSTAFLGLHMPGAANVMGLLQHRYVTPPLSAAASRREASRRCHCAVCAGNAVVTGSLHWDRGGLAGEKSVGEKKSQHRRQAATLLAWTTWLSCRPWQSHKMSHRASEQPRGARLWLKTFWKTANADVPWTVASNKRELPNHGALGCISEFSIPRFAVA